jgi:hypothetical protein
LTVRDFVRGAFNTIMRWAFRAPQGIECHTLVKDDYSKSIELRCMLRLAASIGQPDGFMREV